jgi:hypothetical protein
MRPRLAQEALLEGNMSKWADDAFLDSLRAEGDALADATVERLAREGGTGDVSRVFQMLRANGDPLPSDAPPPFVEFFDATRALGPDVDMGRVKRGEAVYLRHSLTAALVLLAKSLPEGYAAPNLTEVLAISGDLGHHPYRRLLGVLQLVVNISSTRGFEDGGRAVISAQKMRLLHAGVRRIVHKKLPDFSKRYGVPVNHEDMLGTLMGFSYLVIEGLRTLDVGLLDDEAEDLYYVWRVFGRCVGIHPTGDATSFEYLPETIDDCAAFYESYARRHYVDAADNPKGVELAQANLQMMQDLLSRHGHWPGLKSLPRAYMFELMGDEMCARIGLDRTAEGFLESLADHLLPPILQGVSDLLPGKIAEKISDLIFQGLIDHSYGQSVEFLVPDDVEDLRKLA